MTDLEALIERLRAAEPPTLDDLADAADALSAALKVTEPFEQTDRAIGDLDDPIRVETMLGYREMKRADFRNIAHWRQTGKDKG